ncbi:MAG: alpha-amylase [Cryomorphaceae bacterium]|nr:alpha-amylase [Cryomorphaceae bacterium]
MHKLLIPLLALVACSSPQILTPETYADELPGLASPIRLQPDTTVIYLSDYFANTGPFVAVFNNDTLVVDSLGIINFSQNPKTPISALEVTYNKSTYQIPVFKSKKVTFEFSYFPTSPKVKTVALAGSMNGWNPSATPLTFDGTAWTTSLTLDPAVYQYKIVEDGNWMLDPNNENQLDNGQGAMNSALTIGNPNEKRPALDVAIENDSLKISSDMDGTTFIWWEDKLILSAQVAKNEVLTMSIPALSKNLERSTIRIWTCTDKTIGDDVIIPLHFDKPILNADDLTRGDLHNSIMYFLMVDRFADGDSTNNNPVEDPTINEKANHKGGDFTGVNYQVNTGYFDSLGINTLWISPITLNAEGAWGLWNKGITSTFSGYHGYWPVSSSKIDPHFGTDQSFRSLIDEVHNHDMNIIVDYVANHVHQDHPVYKLHPDWATSLYLPDGTMNTERWDEYRLTTWFDTFLATLDLENPIVAEAMTDSAMFWIENYPLDGFRHDATKHIPENFWRSLTMKVKSNILAAGKNKTIFQIGETYGNPELISSYVSSGMLDAQFDFNLYDAAVDAFANPNAGFTNLSRVLNEGLQAYGTHHLMGNISGNQDRARFISYADGSVKFGEDAKLAGWTREINNVGSKGFDEMRSLIAFIMTTPGIPCVYYGDEIGMPGGNDPDNRRVMQFDNLNEDQQALRNATSALAKLRRNRMSLMYGGTKIIQSDDQALVFERNYLGEITTVMFAKKPTSISLQNNKNPNPQLLEGNNCSLIGYDMSFSGYGFAIVAQ